MFTGVRYDARRRTNCNYVALYKSPLPSLTNIVHVCKNLLHVRIFVLGIWIFVSAILRWIRVSIREEFRMDRSANSNLNFKYYSPSFLEGYDSYRFEYNSKVSISLCRKISSWIVSGVLKVENAKGGKGI